MPAISILSSMATRRILGDLVESWKRKTGHDATVLSIGGVDAAKRLRAGEAFDIAVLADDALRGLAGDGVVVADSIVAFARSAAAVAVPSGAGGVAPRDADAIRHLLARARKVGISTGPSGKAVRFLLQGWGIGAPACEIVEAKPGIPVARLLATGEAELGFQQLSELLGEPGITILGPVPADVLPVTVFAMGICKSATDAASAKALIDYLRSAETAMTKQQQGMEPG